MAERDEAPDFSPLNSLDAETCGGSSYPFSFPSQPPDIRNWFSSYQYESPETSELPHGIGSFQLEGEEGESETQEPLGSLGTRKGEEPHAAKERDVFHPLRHLSDWKCSVPDERSQYKSCDKTDFVRGKGHLNMAVEFDGKYDQDKEGDTHSIQPVENTVSVEDHDQFRKKPEAESKRKQNSQQDVEEQSLEKCEEEGSADDLFMSRASEMVACARPGNAAEPKAVDCVLQNERSFLKDNSQHPLQNLSTGGFISTKKREGLEDKRASRPLQSIQTNRTDMKAVNRRGWRGSCEHLTGESSTLRETKEALAGKEKGQSRRVGVLEDRTNIQINGEVAAVAAIGIPGKWKCPRKSKPYIGPPMKQLRLENWVHKVKN